MVLKFCYEYRQQLIVCSMLGRQLRMRPFLDNALLKPLKSDMRHLLRGCCLDRLHTDTSRYTLA